MAHWQRNYQPLAPGTITGLTLYSRPPQGLLLHLDQRRSRQHSRQHGEHHLEYRGSVRFTSRIWAIHIVWQHHHIGGSPSYRASVVIDTLSPGATYHFRVRSRDSDGVLAAGLDNTFAIAAP